MGRELFDTQPVFRRVLQQCADLLGLYGGRSLIDVLYYDRVNPAMLDATDWAQPAVFAVQAALCEMLSSWGVVPTAVIGHSAGEIAAAYVAGVFTIEDGLRMASERGRLMQHLSEDGTMIAVFATEPEVAARVSAHSERVAIAAVNDVRHVVVSGATDVVATIAGELEATGIQFQKLAVSRAFHSPLMRPVLAPFSEAFRMWAPKAPSITFISNITGSVVASELISVDYWRRHIVAPVRFLDGMMALRREKPSICVEIGPKPVLIALARGVFADDAPFSATLREGSRDWESLMTLAGALHVSGIALKWGDIDAGFSRRNVSLPTYPFQRQRYWIHDTPSGGGSVIAKRNVQRTAHPLLVNARQELRASGEVVIHMRVSDALLPELRDHRVRNTKVFPTSAYLDLVQAAAVHVFQRDVLQLEDLEFQHSFFLTGEPRPLMLTFGPTKHGLSRFVFSGESRGAQHDYATGRLRVVTT
jgi:myxalamid-type polyketide synthase MxaB